ncbi:reverse transcriptase [Gossypium australe]|uniref:Reverse transcriptase n=1 Tax=Gossypium australe TaxID=47621 RepID=A0A5B6X2F5_9ROSI|nr:reverse transcriptase [Gossypium australe]
MGTEGIIKSQFILMIKRKPHSPALLRMSFGLCNALATCMRCMIVIFADMLEERLDVFMDDFFVYGDSFQECLDNLEKVLKRCEETNLVLNWEKCHFMVKEGLVLGHQISRKDKANIEVIKNLLNLTNVTCVQNFLSHAGFYRIFIKDFAYISKPLNQLLQNETPFVLDQSCQSLR